jgi:hypothetical protein
MFFAAFRFLEKKKEEGSEPEGRKVGCKKLTFESKQ